MRVSWMQWVLLGVLGVLGVLGLGAGGCDEGAPLPLVIGSIILPDPCAPYTDTVFPANGVGDVHVICSQCSDTCGSGDSCASYGALCDFGSVPGICTGCCEGGLGELRCTKL